MSTKLSELIDLISTVAPALILLGSWMTLVSILIVRAFTTSM